MVAMYFMSFGSKKVTVPHLLILHNWYQVTSSITSTIMGEIVILVSLQSNTSDFIQNRNTYMLICNMLK
jgi:hypothetical protein